MKLILVVFFALVFVPGCKSKGPYQLQERKHPVTLNQDALIKKFCLPYDENFLTDSNSLIFYHTQSFDTNYLIHIKYINGDVVGSYYETLPKFHRDLEGYDEKDIQILFFDGFSFKIDGKRWDNIKFIANEMHINDSSTQSKLCFDCDSYFLAYNSRVWYDSRENSQKLTKINDYLKASIIDKVNKTRREFEAPAK